MMETPLSDPETAQRLLAEARRLYLDLTTELNRAIEMLRDGVEDPQAKGRAEAIRAHRKALQTILDIQMQFVTRTDQANGEGDLDLDAARAEIRSRLDRLSAASGD